MPTASLGDIMQFSAISIQKCKDWLKKTGTNHFKKIIKEHGTLNACWDEDGIPHIVHFREGMQVRNFMRSLEEFKVWDAHKLDNSWQEFILECIGEAQNV